MIFLFDVRKRRVEIKRRAFRIFIQSLYYSAKCIKASKNSNLTQSVQELSAFYYFMKVSNIKRLFVDKKCYDKMRKEKKLFN